VIAHQQQCHLRLGQYRLNLIALFRARLDLVVVPQAQHLTAISQHRCHHPPQPLNPNPIEMAVADEHMLALGGWFGQTSI
jgi:hypothetical protein